MNMPGESRPCVQCLHNLRIVGYRQAMSTYPEYNTYAPSRGQSV